MVSPQPWVFAFVERFRSLRTLTKDRLPASTAAEISAGAVAAARTIVLARIGWGMVIARSFRVGTREGMPVKVPSIADSFFHYCGSASRIIADDQEVMTWAPAAPALPAALA
ncbi:hypothetical protein X743_02055 [Mesorhizobium sp. LNHC252B00]|nr:hypothetical protein X743_02055 [Mesorhizobium sp. LNHC252B00]